MREVRVEAYLKKLVESYGGTCDKWVCPGKTGVPDRIIKFYPGVIAFAETKALTGRLRFRQKRVIAELREQGFEVAVLHTKQEVKLWVELFVSTEVRQALLRKKQALNKVTCEIVGCCE